MIEKQMLTEANASMRLEILLRNGALAQL